MSPSVPVVVLAFVLSAIVAVILTRYSLQLKLLDIPNERSSHTNPTPRGGGIAIVGTCTVGILFAIWTGHLDAALATVLLVGGLVVAAVGFVDDFKGVSTRIRLVIHFFVALLALSVMEGTSALQIGNRSVELGGLWYVVAILGVIWAMNLFNFMDGIDGIAASESGFIALSGALISIPMTISSGVSVFAAILAGSSLGFLRWNWQPARVFMGDVGSCYIGYVLAVLVLASASQHSAAIWVWLVLGGGFFVDATVTLVRRLARGERVYNAHREHAYQRQARRFRSHATVTTAFTVVNVLWLLPAAILCAFQPERAIYIAGGALLPLVVLAAVAGAGRAEQAAESALTAGRSSNG
ncbi:MAG: MraY family glycosyltransferase [Gammaproteobacteria bacterium]